MTESEINKNIMVFLNDHPKLVQGLLKESTISVLTVKWSTIIRTMTETILTDRLFWTKESEAYLCIMFEVILKYVSANYENAYSLPSESFHDSAIPRILLESVLKKVKTKTHRSKIVGTWFNLETNQQEWELENGEFIPTSILPKARRLEIGLDDLPNWLVKIVDKAVSRDNLITEILDEDRK